MHMYKKIMQRAAMRLGYLIQPWAADEPLTKGLHGMHSHQYSLSAVTDDDNTYMWISTGYTVAWLQANGPIRLHTVLANP